MDLWGIPVGLASRPQSLWRRRQAPAKSRGRLPDDCEQGGVPIHRVQVPLIFSTYFILIHVPFGIYLPMDLSIYLCVSVHLSLYPCIILCTRHVCLSVRLSVCWTASPLSLALSVHIYIINTSLHRPLGLANSFHQLPFSASLHTLAMLHMGSSCGPEKSWQPLLAGS